MKNRLFTFGCSFTKYRWPTWADILGQEFDDHQNWGETGAGNLLILCSLMEAIQRESISSNDTVIIMWSSPGREDRWVKGNWITPGNIYNQDIYPKDWVDKFADPDGYLIRDLALISSANKVLDSIKCDYHMLSMMPLNIVNDSERSLIEKIKSKFNILSGQETKNVKSTIPSTDKVTNLYQDIIDKIKPSVFETVFNNDWYSRKGFKAKTWVEVSYKDSRKTWAPHWPTYEDFINKQLTEEMLQELKQFYGFDDIDLFINEVHRFENRDDVHPTPIEHLEYLNKVLPKLLISKETVEWTQKKQIDAEKGIEYIHPQISRL
jgi:hypothetical protein